MGARLFSPRNAATIASEKPPAPMGAGRGREAAALVLFAFGAYLSLAMASLEVDPRDPTVAGANWVGPVGARLAEALARGFGFVAWALPVELVVVGRPLFRRQAAGVSGLRVAGNLVVAIVLSALVHIALPSSLAFGRLPAGGNVGLLFGELFQALFSTLGSFLVGGTVVGLILIGRSSFSFIEVCRRSVELGEVLSKRIWALLLRLRTAWASARLLHRQERAQQAAASRPKIDNARSDEAIIAELADDAGWRPLEQTGAPPLTLADSLRGQLEVAATGESGEPDVAPIHRELRMENERPTQLSKPQVAGSDQAPAPAVISAPAARADASSSKGSDDVVKIVDTSHLTRVERAPAARNVRKHGFSLPDTELLEPASKELVNIDEERVFKLAQRLEKTLSDYGITAKVEEVHPGPTVTTYEVSPQAGTKVSKVASLSDDLALGLSRKVRIIAPIPGKARIGFELPNDQRVPVNLRELIEDKRFKNLADRAPLPVVLGRDIVGAPFYADLAAMPHVIVAGATGAGKSVGLNVMLSSLLFKRSPDELRMLMIDPKVVELAPFDGIPHMLLPVVTDMRQAAKALKWAVDEMEKRYQAFAIAGTKNIGTYNRWVDRVQAGELPAPIPREVEALTADGCPVSVPAAKTGSDGVALPGRMPHIVIVVDEFADLIMQQGKDVEAAVARLAQKARAAGMHVVLATQRPSVDVITGMIKANFPTRIAYRVAQKVDSRTILDEMGAELLLGKGDMLVKLNGSTETHRVQCPFISEEEVDKLTAYLRAQGTPVYHDDILKGGDDDEDDEDAADDLDPRFDEAVRIVADTQRCSTSWLQRKMTIGYNRAAKIVESMEARGIVGPPNGSKEREIFAHPQ
jgi:S-DNA-T family DNA segregation ATPase FtsK/SpoIIIE